MTTAADEVRLALATPDGAPEIEARAAREGWVLLERRPATSSSGAVSSWELPALLATVYVVDDRFIGQSYLVLVGEDAERAAAGLRSSVALVDLAEAQALARPPGATAQRESALRMVAVLAPVAYDETLMHLLADGLMADELAIRATALEALAAIGWVELHPLAAAVAAADVDPGLRTRASAVLGAFIAVHQG